MRNRPRSSSRTAAREHAVTRHPVSRQVPPHHPPQLRQRFGELEHLVELLLIAPCAPIGVVEVLLAARRVDAGRLQMAARVRADPHVLPGGRDRQRADAIQRHLSSSRLPSGSKNSKPAAAAAAADTRLGTVDASQSAHRPTALAPAAPVANAGGSEPPVLGYPRKGCSGRSLSATGPRAWCAVSSTRSPPGTSCALLEVVDPEIEFFGPTATAVNEGRCYRGRDGMRRYLRDAEALWEKLEPRPAEATAWSAATWSHSGAFAHVPGTGSRSTRAAAWVWRVEHGRVTWGCAYGDPDQMPRSLQEGARGPSTFESPRSPMTNESTRTPEPLR